MHIFISINDHIFKDWRKWKEKKHRLRGAAGKGQDMKERQQKRERTGYVRKTTENYRIAG